MNDNPVAYISDIVKEVSKKTGYSERMVELHVEFLVDWINNKIEDPDVLTIGIPHVGKLYSLVALSRNYYNDYSNDEKYNKGRWGKLLKFHKNKVDKFESLFGKKVEKYNKHLRSKKIRNNFFTKGMSSEELEKWQNNGD